MLVNLVIDKLFVGIVNEGAESMNNTQTELLDSCY